MSDYSQASELFKNVSQTTWIQIVLIIAVSWFIIWASKKFIPIVAQHVPQNTRFFIISLPPVIRLIVLIIAFVMIVNRLIEPTFEKLIAIMGGMAVALGFAFKDYISSLIAGVVTLYERPFRPGDWIEINGAYGQVRRLNMRNVEMVTPDDTVVYIPHSKLWTELIHNGNDSGPNLMCVTNFYLKPQHNAAEVKNTLTDVALTSPFLQLKQPVIVVVLEKPWGTHYRLKGYPIEPAQQFQFITDLTIRGKVALAQLGVEFASAPASIAINT